MPTLKNLEDQARTLAAKQLEIVNDTAKPWSERKNAYDGLESDLKDVLEQHMAMKCAQNVDAMLGGDDAPAPDAPRKAERKSWGRQIVESNQFKQAQNLKGGRFTTGALELKDFTMTDDGDPGPAAGGSVPQYLPGIVDIKFRRLVVRDLLAQGVMSSPVLTYMKESSATNAAAAVAEGGLKPTSELVLVQVSERAGKVATLLKTSDEALEDVAFAESYIDGRLRLFVSLAEEDQLLNGSGTDPNLTGLNNRTGKQTAQALGSDTRPDAVYKQITNIRVNSFLDPTGIVMNPADWQDFRLLKDGNGQYYAGGPFGGQYGVGGLLATETLWGLPVVTTPAQPVGTALVGAFNTAAQVFQRSALRVEVSNSDSDDFAHNRIAFRAEERLGLAVYRPGAFGQVTGI